MKNFVKGWPGRLSSVRRRWSVSTSFVRWGAPRWHLRRVVAVWRLSPARRGSWWLRAGVASRVRVREVAGPKSRCPGSGRPRWTSESPPNALPGLPALVPGWRRRRRAGGRPRRRAGGAGSASLPSRSWTAAACGGSKRGPQCRCGAGPCRPCKAGGSACGYPRGTGGGGRARRWRHRSGRSRPGRQNGYGRGTGRCLPRQPGSGQRRRADPVDVHQV